MRAEISYDLVMDDNMSFIEGTYRLPDKDWQVFIVFRHDVTEPEVILQTWHSGVTGVFIKFPQGRQLNKFVLERLLSAELGVSDWVELQGPDSMQLR